MSLSLCVIMVGLWLPVLLWILRDAHAFDAIESESPQDRSSRRTASATIWIAMLSVATVVVGGLQYLTFNSQLKVMADQLEEMKGTGRQTDELIAANKKVAEAAQGQLEALRGQLNQLRKSGEQADQLIEANKKLAEAASVQAQAAKDTALTAHENLVASQRAWVAPIRFVFADLNNAQQPLRVRMTYQNVGREPARNVRNYLTAGYIRNPIPPSPKEWGNNRTWFSMEAIKPRSMCGGTAPDKNSVIYPSPTIGFDIEMGDPPDGADVQALFEEVKNKKSIYFVAGCLSYETVKERRSSAFCAMLMPVEGKEISQWQFSACPIGNDDF
jgi:hypothetical protein